MYPFSLMWSMCWWIVYAFSAISDFNIEATNADEVVTGQGQSEDGATMKETSGEIMSSNISKGESVTKSTHAPYT